MLLGCEPLSYHIPDLAELSTTDCGYTQKRYLAQKVIRHNMFNVCSSNTYSRNFNMRFRRSWLTQFILNDLQNFMAASLCNNNNFVFQIFLAERK